MYKKGFKIDLKGNIAAIANLEKLVFEKNRAEAIINSLKDPSIGVTIDNKVFFVNCQALQLLRLNSGEVLDKSIEELSKNNDLFNFLFNHESSIQFEIEIKNKNHYFINEIIYIGQGENKNKVIVLKNITPFVELDVAKTNFIATIAHELKTPIAASDFSLRLLEDERITKLSDEQKELIQNLKEDNQRLLKILNELGKLSQVEAGKIELNIQIANPYLIVEKATKTVLAIAKERNLEITQSLENNLPLIEADTEKTTWVLNNLLTNAIKYCVEGGTINITAKKAAGNILFSVEDQGPGIAREYQSSLFERHFQVPGSKVKGTGLGLCISKELIEGQNGKIWVESSIGKGSIFSFSLACSLTTICQ